MKINSFEEIVAWQKARELVLVVYKLCDNLKDYEFRNQMCSAAVSVMNNIAEGFERRGDKEFSHFLYIAKGSCGEVRSMGYVALDLKYINQIKFQEVQEKAIEISKILSGLIKSLNN